MSGRPAPDWLVRWEYAHRGLHSDGVPENSLDAARAAIAAGMGIECDVQRSRDDHPFVFHDWELERLTDGAGPTWDLDAEHLERLSLLGTDQNPIRLEALLDCIDGRVPLLIEIKSFPDYDVTLSCEAVAAALMSYRGEHAVMSFDPRVGEWFATHAPQTVRGLVCTDTLDHGWLSAWRDRGAIESADPDFLAVDIRDLPNAICSLWKETGRALLSWTVRSQSLRQKALNEAGALISEGAGLT